jgi:hypothetical protein
VDVGWRNDANPTGLPRLRVNNVYYDGAGSPVHGGWATYTTTYVAQAADVGLPIAICLNSVSHQGNFDNVRFEDSTTPSGVAPGTPTPVLQLQARPNPFGAATQIRFSSAPGHPGPARFDVWRPCARLAGFCQAGAHDATWDGMDDAGARFAWPLFLWIEAGAQPGRAGALVDEHGAAASPPGGDSVHREPSCLAPGGLLVRPTKVSV